MGDVVPLRKVKKICSFCGENKKLMVGNGKAHICKDCLDAATKRLAEHDKENEVKK